MIEHIVTILKLIVAALPFIVLCLGSRKINLQKIERSKQFPMPAVALVYNIIIVCLLHRINEWLLGLFAHIPVWIARLADVSWIPNVLDNAFLKAAEWIQKLFTSLNLNLWVFFAANALIILVYLFLKRIIIEILRKTVKYESGLYQSVAGLIYERDEENDVMCVKEEYSQTRGFFRTFYYAAVAISSVLFIVSRYSYQDQLIKAVFYPVFGVILLGEIWFLLDGLTQREYRGSVLGEDDRAQKTVNYTLIKKFLRSLFGDKLNVEDTRFNSDLFYEVTNEDVFKPFRDSDDRVENSFGAFYEALVKSGFQLDHNYFYSSHDLMCGKSILFNNPFYNDLIPYAFYPMNRSLLNHGKVLVVLGRHAIEKDVEEWLYDGIEAVTNIPFMWKINTLGELPVETDIGIMTRSDVLNVKVHDANEEFLNNVDYVVIIEPSKLISTAQIGINMLVKKCQAYRQRNIVYCMCDKNCDGLVDAMSHILLTSITEVSATGKHKGVNSYMGWDVDDDYLQHRMLPAISRYLGVGTELSFAALKNQVSTATWYGGEAFPVTDMRWIDHQYYFDLMKYAQLPANQDEMDKRFVTSPNFWGAKAKKYNYITVEDEAFNMFEAIRDFSTRATEQGFVNVITSDYLLKEYMADNADIFEADPKAIPCIVPDFVRSRRNTVLKLLLMMSIKPTAESLIEKELSLENINVYSLKEQLWHEIWLAVSDSVSLAEIPENYEDAVAFTAERKLTSGRDKSVSVGIEAITVQERFNLRTGKMEQVYAIKNKRFIEEFVADLRSASYVAEDEKGSYHYFGAELRGHVFQKYLPGQFFTFDGKYYCMDGLTAEGDILVRRSADHITGRKYYRQNRQYVLSNRSVDAGIGAAREIAGVKIVHEHADISVHTSGYLEMAKYGDFRNARPVKLDIEGVEGIDRYVSHKSFLRIELPENDGALNDNIRYTVTVLMNEVFRSLFAENQGFVVALTDDSFLAEDAVRPLTYSVETETEAAGRCIYIVEDSRLDLGLLDAVERNIDRILDIISDYICWHNEKLDEVLDPPPEPEPVPVDLPPEPVPEKKKSLLRRIIDKLTGKDKKEGKDGEQTDEPGKKKGFFGRLIDKLTGKDKKKGEPVDDEPIPAPEPQPEPEPVPAPEPIPEDQDDIPEPPEGDREETDDLPPDDLDDLPTEDTDVDDLNAAFELPTDGTEDEDDTTDLPTDGTDELPADDTEDMEDLPELPVDDTEDAIEAPVLPAEDVEEEDEAPVLPAEDVEETDEAPVLPVEDVEEVIEPPVLPVEDVEEVIEAPVLPADDVEPSDADPIGEGAFAPDEANMPAPEDVPEDRETVSEQDLLDDWSKKTERRPYNERYYTLFGYTCEPAAIDLDATYDYLSSIKIGKNSLTQARDNRLLSEYMESLAKKENRNLRRCDFCGAEILGIEYETLTDGRDRCMNCSRTAIKTGEEFKALFDNVKHDLESYFNIRIRTGVRVEMVNSRELHKRLGETFTPTAEWDGRTLGVAILEKKTKQFSLLVENGSPRMSTMLTVAHELTHIWQYVNWDEEAILKKYGPDLNTEIYEGMAKWVEVQYAWLINEAGTAKRRELTTMTRPDPYGRGFIRYRANYPFSKGVGSVPDSPFMHPDAPLADEFCIPLNEMFIIPPEIPQPVESKRQKRRERKDWLGSDRDNRKRAVKGSKNRDPENVRRYAYSMLDDAEKAMYERMAQALADHEEDVEELGEIGLSKERFEKAVNYAVYDNPAFFWYAGFRYQFSQDTGIVQSMHFDYCMTREEAEARQREIDENIGAFREGITDAMSDFEVVLKVYENIIQLIDYDSVGLDAQKKEREEDENARYQPDDLRSVYGVFVNRKAVCAGYARATQYLLNAYGLECAYYSNGEHAWNVLNLEGDYYHLDTTWGDASNTRPEENGRDEVGYDSFCVTSADIARLNMHQLNPDYPAPECTAVQCNYYRRFGAYFEAYDYEAIRDLAASLAANGSSVIAFRCADDAVYSRVESELIDNHKFSDILQFINLKTKVRVDTAYSYVRRPDFLTFKFYLNKIR
ncbi:MAG: hypothetical protein IJL25_08055 [Clostridia bacterium]|nr:hypothetical protein [Clostridia bacterium]